jgi:AcrR family transcriptional regulator
VKEICAHAGVSKMTFYRFFDNKLDLVKTILDLIFEKSITGYNEIMAKDISFYEKVKLTLLAKFADSQDVSQELFMDLYKNKDVGVLTYIQTKSDTFMDKFLDDYEQAQKDGYIRKGIKRAFIRYQVQKMREMVIDEKLLAFYKDPQELTMEMMNFFFYGLLEPEK